jgi:hypothetical protein
MVWTCWSPSQTAKHRTHVPLSIIKMVPTHHGSNYINRERLELKLFLYL